MENGQSFDEAVSYAQNIGIAETDPSGDVDGWDAAIKIAALATVLMNRRISVQPLSILISCSPDESIPAFQDLHSAITDRGYKIEAEPPSLTEAIASHVFPPLHTLPPGEWKMFN